MGVGEIWFWKNNRLRVYHLREENIAEFLEKNSYEQITLSQFLPELNISLLEQCRIISDQIKAVDEFERGINS
ncbi:hypothetical protein [Nostoc sp.]|uniref:hypothetical protein n=1 Tax=Nostoc sp. TaxID=1180 RepID=UPI002FF6351F